LDLAHLQVERQGRQLCLGQARGAATPFSHRLPLPGVAEIPEAGVTMTASYQETGVDPALSSGLGYVATVQGPMTPGPLTVRSRQPGDRLQPLGAPGHRKLHDLLIDRKIPRAVRDRVPVVVDAAGHIVWVVGVTIAHEHRVTTPQTGVVVLKCVGTQDT
jgi:tRNA(Ile)-lysidine synthase